MPLELPQDADVLVSNPSATIEYAISIVPQRPHMACPNHDSAVAEGRRLAEQLKVDAWLTEDHRHFLRIASFRPGRRPPVAGSAAGPGPLGSARLLRPGAAPVVTADDSPAARGKAEREE